MWKNINGRLIHSTDETREKFRTSISTKLLVKLEHLAEEHNTYINYLLETGIKKVLEADFIQYDKSLRPKDRVQYQTTYDKALLKQLKQFASEHKVFINDVIEYSANYVEPNISWKREHRNRIERF